ncbi:hypothetical protein K458DRAFT_410410 [Lentithecium fluviatile CBS 122367]|uniref:Uncharacterized protein n=1 Tax=Lentithecium fluviatile CBS 122367 TaxID=1168545 RepID=A0A6G1IE15_9PLEO|nr:hypothetical protein K458DRAFT_410410 [Lentithecium fluviatile CBS 122367]
MKFTLILAALSATFGAIQAADICRPTGSDCFGAASCCLGIQEGRCCNLGTATTRIRMVVPANSRSQGWTGSGCTGSAATNQNQNARTVCFTYSSSRLSGKWLTGLSSRVRRDPTPEAEACAEPNAVLQVRDGVTTRIDLRDGMTVEDALEKRDGVAVEAVPYVGEYEVVNED